MLLLIVILGGLAMFFRKRLRSLQRLASIELKNIARDFDIHNSNDRLLKDLSVFLRRVALHDNQKRVAGLTGTEWLQHLDELSQYPIFMSNYSDVLLAGPYKKDISFDSKSLLKDVQLWARKLK